MLSTTSRVISQSKTKSRERSNEDWVNELAHEGPEQAAAVEALRLHLLRAVKAYLGRQGKRLQRFAWSEIEQIAEDFTQDSMLKVLDNLHTFQGKSRFTTWAMRVAINTAASGLRKNLWKDVSLVGTNDEGEELSIVDALRVPERRRSPEAALQRQEAIDVLREIIKTKLTERQRIVMLNVLVHGMPLDVIAERMNTNRNNVYKVTHDARLKLKNCLRDSGLSPEYVLSLFAETG